jgi:predicted RNA-binding protein associated with RNAse of E/G family
VSVVRVDGRKWPDQLHWQFEAERLGEDEYGVWLAVPRGTIARRGHDPAIRVPHGFVLLVPENEFWFVEFYWDHSEHAVYINIGTQPEWDGDRFTQIDLDLDVIRKPDGLVKIIDEDEFLEHQVRYGYPPDLVATASSAAQRAAELLEAGSEPFGNASLPWLDMAGLR